MKTDVLVIGGGLSGLMCAQKAAEASKVVLISNGRGASPYIHGINVPLHKDDSIALFIKDTKDSGRHQGKKALVDKLCSESQKLSDIYCFDKDKNGYDLLKPLGATVPRVAGIKRNTGKVIIKDILDNKKFTEIHNVRAMRLECKNNKAVGAYCFDLNEKRWFFISAKAIVIATGGFGGIYPFSTNSFDIGGDGIAMAYNIGASICDMEFIQFEPSVAVYPPELVGKSIITTMLYEGATIKNCHNERFMDERVNKDELSFKIYMEILKGNKTEHNGVYYDMTGVEKNLLLTKYADYYERYKKHGIDISKEMVEIAPGPHTTLGGIEIDDSCKTNIEGVFACGEAIGGLHGANRLGGNAGLETIVFGRIAGESSSLYANSCEETFEKRVDDENIDFDDEALKSELKSVLKDGLNVIRNEKCMKNLKNVTEGIMNLTKDLKYSYKAQRLYNDALTIYLAVESALYRKESIGCHIREDSVAESEKYTVIIKKENEKLSIKKRLIFNDQ